MGGTIEVPEIWFLAAISQKRDFEYFSTKTTVPPALKGVLTKVVELMWCRGKTTCQRSRSLNFNHWAIDSALAQRLESVKRTPLGKAVVPEVKRIKASLLGSTEVSLRSPLTLGSLK